MDIMSELREFRKMVEGNAKATRKLIRVDDLSPEEIQDIIGIYDRFQVGHAYEVGDIFQYQGELFEVISAHTSQADWVPSELPALYKNFMPEDIIPEWVQPLGGHDAYEKGSKVIYEDKVYISTVDSNVWSPVEYGWELHEE